MTFSVSHLTALSAVLVATLLCSLVGRGLSPRGRRTMGLVLAGLLLANELIYYVWTAWYYGPASFLERFLPLHICGAAVFLLAWTAFRNSDLTFEVSYYWGLGGTTQALLTPDLGAPFPQYHFWQYFLTHGGIVVLVVFLLAVWQMRPRKGSILRVFLITNAYMGLVAVANVILRQSGLDANYMFLCRAPEGESPFFFLGWPWYILFLEAFALVTVALLYLPWARTRPARQREKTESVAPADDKTDKTNESPLA